MKTDNKHEYSISWLEKLLNGFINFVFYFRLILVFLALVSLGFIAHHIWYVSANEEKYKNLSLVCGLGSIAIGIFYSILNYENNHLKSKSESIKARLVLSFNSVGEWHKPAMIENLKITKKLYNKHKHLIDDNKGREYFDIMEDDEDGRSALVSILNYFECISYGIKNNVLDNDYLKDSLGGVARFYVNNYGFYINYRRTVHNSPAMWQHYTDLIEKWGKV